MARPVRISVVLMAAAFSVLLSSCGELSLKALIRQNVEEYKARWYGSVKVVGSPTDHMVWNPQLAIDGSTLYLTYLMDSADLNAIGVKNSVDGGRTWNDFGGGQVATAPHPHILQVSNGEPHIFFHDSSTTQIRYTKWLASAWRNNIYTLSASSVDAATGMLNGSMLLSGNVFLAWYDTSTSSLWYNFSINPWWLATPGNVISSFNYLKQLTGGSTGRTGGLWPSMQRDSSGTLYILYADPSNRPMLITAANDNLDFADPFDVYNGPASSVITGSSLALTESGGVVTVHAVWSTSVPMRQLYYSHTTSSDLSTWSTPLDLNVNTKYGKNFQLAAGSNGKLYLLHQSSQGTTGIVLTTSSNGGLSWSHQTLDSDPSFAGGIYSSVALVVSGSKVYAAYSTASPHPNGWSITLIHSYDGGQTW